jgi:hypothetical protein
MPCVPRGNTNLPVMMVAEKLSADAGEVTLCPEYRNDPSCPALCRASTSFSSAGLKEDVDGLAKGRSRPSSTGYARP